MQTVASQWLDRISRAKKREKHWRKDAEKAVEIYEGRRQEQIAFNILYSNTETLVPALYNSTPRPQVQRRFKDADPLGKSAAITAQRIAEFCLDTNGEEYQPFDTIMIEAVVDAATAGRAVSRVRYDADIYDKTEKSPSILNGELICYESVSWNRITFGYARKWTNVAWIAFEHDVTKVESEKLFGKEITAKLIFTEHPYDETEEEERHEDEKKDDDRKTAKLHEIWDKDKKEIVFVADCYKEDVLKVDDDPKQFTGFYPIPEPLRFLRKSNNQLPTTLYSLYENQAKELNRITIRINKIVEAIKVRGAYNSAIAELGNIFQRDDNELVPAENLAALQETKGLENAIWLVPIEKYVTVLQQLYPAREACKQVIYEITGIADIMRGVTKASETLGAQELKDQWGTLRLKRMQRDVANYARDLIRMTIEVAAKTLTIPTIQKMTGLPFPTAKVKVQAQQAIMIAQESGQPPNPLAIAAASAPAWEEIMAALQDNTLRQYKIDIETNSTVDLAATEDKKDMAELMSAMSQFMSGVAPLVESGSMPFQAAQAMLLAIVRQFRFGADIEDLIKQMQPPQPRANNQGAAKEIQAQFELGQANAKVQQLEAEKKLLERKVGLDITQVDLKAKEMGIQQREDALNMRSQMALKELEMAQTGHLQSVQNAFAAHEIKVRSMLEGAKTHVKTAAMTTLAKVKQETARQQMMKKAPNANV